MQMHDVMKENLLAVAHLWVGDVNLRYETTHVSQYLDFISKKKKNLIRIVMVFRHPDFTPDN